MVYKKYVVKKQGKLMPSKYMKKIAWVSDISFYKKANKNPVNFWEDIAKKDITWDKPFTKAYKEKIPHFSWFSDGKLNMSYNCVDRHLKEKGDKTAIIWVPEPIKEKIQYITYKQLYENICKFANILKKIGIKKGDSVGIYMPMILETFYAMLACTRIGAMHTVVFSAFSAEATKTRLQDANAKLLITSDGYYRRGEFEELKEKAKQAVVGTKVKKILVIQRKKTKKPKLSKKEVLYNDLVKKVSTQCKPESLNSETIMFLLYTSGTTGKPKGIKHDTGGYAVQALTTSKYNFNLHDDDIMWCTADIGWITGHTYALYGPLLNGATTLIYEGSPDFPNKDRFWKIVDNNKVTVFYTAPTALRMFQAWGDKFLKGHRLKTLRILGTVGEPIDMPTWNWYFKKIGKKHCPVIDTWWQTETGGTLINELPGVGPFIPSFAGKSFPGTRHAVVNEKGKKVKKGEKGLLVQLPPFAPGMLRGVWGKDGDKKYKKKYFRLKNMYETGDGAFQNKDGEFRILGRTDDVMKVAGHRMSTAELENALHHHKYVGDVAVVSRPDKIRGEVPIAFVELKNMENASDKLKKQLVKLAVKHIGPIAKPHEIYFVSDLPKTRSGKIMRRIMRCLLRNEDLGNLSTIINPEAVEEVKKVIQQSQTEKSTEKPREK